MSFLRKWFGGADRDAPPFGDAEKVRAVVRILDRERAAFRADGGDVRLVGVRDDWVEVRLEGACAGCSAQTQSLEGLLAPRLVAELPWVRGVRVATRA